MKRGQLFSLVFSKLLILNDRPRDFLSIPLRGPLEMHLDRLLRIGEVEPASIRLPSFGDNLNQNSSHWRVRDVRDAIAAGLYIHFQFLVLLYRVLFYEFHVDAGVLHGYTFLAAGDFNRDARLCIARGM